MSNKTVWSLFYCNSNPLINKWRKTDCITHKKVEAEVQSCFLSTLLPCKHVLWSHFRGRSTVTWRERIQPWSKTKSWGPRMCLCGLRKVLSKANRLQFVQAGFFRLALLECCTVVWSQEHNRANSQRWKREARGSGSSGCLQPLSVQSALALIGHHCPIPQAQQPC